MPPRKAATIVPAARLCLVAAGVGLAGDQNWAQGRGWAPSGRKQAQDTGDGAVGRRYAQRQGSADSQEKYR